MRFWTWAYERDWSYPRATGERRRANLLGIYMTQRQQSSDAAMPSLTNGHLGLPLWARVIALVGIPGAIALFTVYMQTVTLPALQRDVQTLRFSYEKTQDTQRELLARQAEIIRLMQRVCSNTAKSDQERARCFD